MAAFWAAPFFAFAQTDTSVALAEVTVVENRLRWLNIGQFSFQLDSTALLLNNQARMAEVLHRESALHIRQYAPGSVATYSTRGATSAQSTVLWGGFGINDAGTGVVDLSLVPSFLFQPALLRGGSAPLFGSGSVGSVLNLVSQPQQKKPFSLSFMQQAGSFHSYTTAARVGLQTKKFFSNTGFFFNSSQNTFTYQDPFSAEKKWLVREQAAFHQWHFLQQFNYSINKRQKISADVWLNDAMRQTPRSVLATNPGKAVLYDKTLRTHVAWQYRQGSNKIDVAYVYLQGIQNFQDQNLVEGANDFVKDTNTTRSQQVRVDYLKRINNKLNWQNGFLMRFDKVGGSNRQASQQLASLQSGLLYRHLKWESQATIRVEHWRSQWLPVSPFLAIKYVLTEKINFSGYGAYNYRIPSMNDLFWVPGGNANLQPEHGITTEVAATYVTQNVQFRTAGYYSRLKEYIRWIPTGALWAPQNAKEVSLSGLDFNLKVLQKQGNNYFTAEAMLSLNRSITQKSYWENDKSVGKQLTYQPKIKSTFNIIWSRNGYATQTSLHHVGEVSTDYGGQSNRIPGYQLLDLSFSKSFGVQTSQITFMMTAANLLNQRFETIRYFPMPGRNYQVTLKIDI